MNPRGLVMIIAGVWMGCQLWRGNALERLNLMKTSS